jgi:hypothetical protein
MYKRSKSLKYSLFITLSLLIAQAGDVSGKWAGIIEIDDSGNKIETPVEMKLEQKDGALSGKIGRTNDPESVEIRNAKVEGDKLTFEASSPEVSASMTFNLTVQGERMHGEMRGAAEGNDIVGKVSFSRVR